MVFEIIKGKLKKAEHEWQEYLLGKELLLCTGLNNTVKLLAIEEMEIIFFCKYLWDNNHFVREDYVSLKELVEDVGLGNYGFGFDIDEIEITETIEKIKLG